MKAGIPLTCALVRYWKKAGAKGLVGTAGPLKKELPAKGKVYLRECCASHASIRRFDDMQSGLTGKTTAMALD